MHQHPRAPPPSASPALSEQTNPTRTNNPRDRDIQALRIHSPLPQGSGSSEEFGNGRQDQPADNLNPAAQLQRLNQVVQNLHTKAALIILHSRVDLSPAYSKNTDQKRVNKWFNIEVDETDEYREDIRRWRQCDIRQDRPPPLIIEVFLTVDPLQQSQKLVILDDDGKRWDVMNVLASSSSNRGGKQRPSTISEVGLERWTIQLDDSPTSVPSDLNTLLPLVYKKGIVLFRALFTYSSILPAYKLSRKVGKSRSTMAMKIGYRIVDGSSTDSLSRSNNLHTPLSDSTGDVTSDYSFGTTDSPAGSFEVKVTYRQNCDFRIDDSESILSSRLLGPDEDIFTPSVRNTTDSRGKAIPDIGSLPNDRSQNLFARPELGQAYGSLNTFHQAGIGVSTSPISALRDAQDYTSTSPPAAEPVRPPTIPQPLNQNSRSSLRAQAGRRSSFSFQPFKSPALSASPLGVSPLGTSPRTTIRGPPLGSLTEESGLPPPNAAAVAARKPASLSSEQAVVSSSSSSPKPTTTKFSSSFSHRRARLSSGGTTTRTDEDQTSSGRASATSSAQPGSGLLTEAGGGPASSGSTQEDDENIQNFLKMLDTSKGLLSPEDASIDGATRRTNAALNRFHRMRDSNAALSDSMTSSLMLHRSSSSSSRQLSSVPPMVAATSHSTSSSPGKPVSPHTPHTPFAPSRLSAAYSHDDDVQHHIIVEEPPPSPSEAATSDTAQARSTTNVPAIDIPNSPRLFLPGYRRSSSAQRLPLSEEDIGDLYGMRSASMGAQDRRQRTQTGSGEQQTTTAAGTENEQVVTGRAPTNRPQTAAAALASDGAGSDSGSARSSAHVYRSRLARGGAGRGVTPPQTSTSSFGGAGSVERSGVESGSASGSWGRGGVRRRGSRPENNPDDDDFLPFAMEKSERF